MQTVVTPYWCNKMSADQPARADTRSTINGRNKSCINPEGESIKDEKSKYEKSYKTLSPYPPRQKSLDGGRRLCAETVEGSSLSLQGVDDIERGDGLSLGVFSVGDGISDNVLEEDL